ncbi:MAG: aminomethyl-transferring glycine dehydrogenase [Microthrixaceae bacterium]
MTSSFARRHLGPDGAELDSLARVVGYGSADALVDAAVPDSIRFHGRLNLPDGMDEHEVLARLAELAGRNRPMVSMIGTGYHDTLTPAVIARNLFENPGWYTAYTPYQPEISQGRLEALINFQTMIAELCGLDLANASMLDEATAAAEAMTMARRVTKSGADHFFVDAGCHPQTIGVVTTRAEPLGIPLVIGDPATLDAATVFGALLASPTTTGAIVDHRDTIAALHDHAAVAVVTADPLALCVIEPPGEQGADIVVGSAQRFGVPMGFGGPHAGFLACRDAHRRSLPGRLVGASVDRSGRVALRLALQTREQHIRRDKATSNICTAQVLLAVMASMYASYHGPEGLIAIAERVHGHADRLASSLRDGGIDLAHDRWFDTLCAIVPGRADQVVADAADRGINLRRIDGDRVGISCDEVTTTEHLRDVANAFGVELAAESDGGAGTLGTPRHTAFCTHEVFARYHSETEMMRYLRRLEDRDLALDRTMIPLGSCTMKLNAATEMTAVSWPGFSRVHPFAPADQVEGYRTLISDLEDWLCEITGYDAVSVQPNAGSQGELAGLLAIRAYHLANGDEIRDVCLIPSSAHGTNAASAVMAGMRVVVVACDEEGNVDMADLAARVEADRDRLAAVMVTYPSTHGVFESTIRELCELVHDAGGQVYLDGANMNAMVGLSRPGDIGSDVSHLNLHKTFCIPHGGGGPGIGPVGVKAHLAPHLPGRGIGAVAAAPFGSASILPISWAYVALMGPDGLTRATTGAIVAANYLATRLGDAYPVLYSGENGLVAHECMFDIRPIEKACGVTNEDIAKRLIDYGFHAPTMSFPVPGTLMVEPTESESPAELDRFVDAMLAIREEIRRIERGEWPLADSPLRLAPHPAEDLMTDKWELPYTREEAAYPLPSLRRDKYWVPVGRVDNGYGDRNLMCSCPPVEAFAEHD